MKNKLYVCLLTSILSFSLIHAHESQNVNQAWQDIQSTLHDAVVQIFVTARDTNWLNPYCIEKTQSTCGTGFFINQTGEIITCSHVVDKALSVFISLPHFGQQRFKANVISICPESDIALLRLTQDACDIICKSFGYIPYLLLGDSDNMHTGEDLLVLGYPLGDKQLKATVGVLSAHLNNRLQYDIATNPGNSGGPVLNKKGMVVGIHAQGNKTAQGTNFAIPINILKSILPDLYTCKLLRINNIFGIIWQPANSEMKKYFGNPEGQGCLICDLDVQGKAALAGLQKNDMIYTVNGYSVDSYGEMIVLANGTTVRFDQYIRLLPLGSEVHFDIYRQGTMLHFTIIVDHNNADSIIYRYPAYEPLEYEVFGGMIIMPLTRNYIDVCAKQKPGLQRYATSLYQTDSRLVITNIIPDSKLDHIKTIRWADTINEVNGEKVTTLDEFRKALRKSIETGFVVIKTTDETFLNTNNALTVLSLYDSCKETIELSHVHQYPLSETVKQLIEQVL